MELDFSRQHLVAILAGRVFRETIAIVVNKYAYCPVNVSRAVGPRIVDRVINNLSNDSDM